MGLPIEVDAFNMSHECTFDVFIKAHDPTEPHALLKVRTHSAVFRLDLNVGQDKVPNVRGVTYWLP